MNALRHRPTRYSRAIVRYDFMGFMERAPALVSCFWGV